MARTVKQLKSLRTLRFIDEWPKPCAQTLAAFCARAHEDQVGQPSADMLRKPVLRVPLTEANQKELGQLNPAWRTMDGIEFIQLL